MKNTLGGQFYFFRAPVRLAQLSRRLPCGLVASNGHTQKVQSALLEMSQPGGLSL